VNENSRSTIQPSLAYSIEVLVKVHVDRSKMFPLDFAANNPIKGFKDIINVTYKANFTK
jgi:hypothetical protein